MKLIKRVGIGLSLAGAIFLAGCFNSTTEKTISDKELSYRKTDLLKPVELPKVEYSKAAPGTSKRFKRAYQDAPPMIPHSVDGLLPITKNNNACLGCHMPSVAKAMGATPIPPSHFMNFRPETKLVNGKIVKDGKVVANATDVKIAKFKKLNKLYPGRFQCTLCHAPQANAKPLVENKFKPEYKKKGAEFKSYLNEDILEGL